MAVQSSVMTVFWVTCDGCKTESNIEETFLEECTAIGWVEEMGWRNLGAHQYCPDCPPLLEVCS
jgi:hypothetical protein